MNARVSSRIGREGAKRAIRIVEEEPNHRLIAVGAGRRGSHWGLHDTILHGMTDSEANRFSARAARYARVGAN
ncbi:MAG: hypothetical protein WB663_18330, partial [Beijerinckiaceae bacterium]